MLKDNPSSIADKARWEELKALRLENEALRSSLSNVPSESIKVFEMKISELQQELSTKEKRMSRLKEVYLVLFFNCTGAECACPGVSRSHLFHFGIQSGHATSRHY